MTDEQRESTPALVTELRRLELEATAGPWKGDEFEATAPKAETAINGNVKLVWAGDYHMNAWDAELVLALRNAAPALLEAVETMHAALEDLHSYQCDSPIECQDKIIWRCQSCKAGDALARVAGLLGEKDGSK